MLKYTNKFSTALKMAVGKHISYLFVQSFAQEKIFC